MQGFFLLKGTIFLQLLLVESQDLDFHQAPGDNSDCNRYNININELN